MRHTFIVLFVISLAACGPPTADQEPLEAGSVDRSIERPGVAGATHRPLDVEDGGFHAVVFLTEDCPIANDYAPEINRIVGDFKSSGVRFFLVHVDPETTSESAAQHAEKHGYSCTVLLDPDHGLVKELGARVSPEAFLLGGTDGRVQELYRGRIDDLYVDFGKKRIEPGQRDLRNALVAAVAGKPVPRAKTEAIGCFIDQFLK